MGFLTVFEKSNKLDALSSALNGISQEADIKRDILLVLDRWTKTQNKVFFALNHLLIKYAGRTLPNAVNGVAAIVTMFEEMDFAQADFNTEAQEVSEAIIERLAGPAVPHQETAFTLPPEDSPAYKKWKVQDTSTQPSDSFSVSHTEKEMIQEASISPKQQELALTEELPTEQEIQQQETNSSLDVDTPTLEEDNSMTALAPLEEVKNMIGPEGQFKTQKEFAEAIGVTQVTASRILRGKGFSQKTAEKVFDVTGVDLLSESESAQPEDESTQDEVDASVPVNSEECLDTPLPAPTHDASADLAPTPAVEVGNGKAKQAPKAEHIEPAVTPKSSVADNSVASLPVSTTAPMASHDTFVRLLKVVKQTGFMEALNKEFGID